jgi:hypothetical protein
MECHNATRGTHTDTASGKTPAHFRRVRNFFQALFSVLGIRDLFSTDLAHLEGERVDIAPDGRLLISVPLDLDIDHTTVLETGWATRLNQ